MKGSKEKWFPVILGILVGIAAALVVLAMSGYGHIAVAESVPSYSVSDLYKVYGSGLTLSEAPLDITIFEVLRVDADVGLINEQEYIQATVRLPYVPEEGLDRVLLYDGYHIAHGAWERTGECELCVTFSCDDLRHFDGTVGLYLVLITRPPD